MRILVINSGSSSIKFRLLEVMNTSSGVTTGPAILDGSLKDIGRSTSFQARGLNIQPVKLSVKAGDHQEALRVLFDRFGGSFGHIDAVGHRVVHGGERYVQSTVITDEVDAGIEALSELAPLHNPACLAGIRGTKAVLGASVPMVAVFDTAFHQTMPDVARRYAIPLDMADRHHIRRYGFHGIAHASLAHGYGVCTGQPLRGTRVITLHLGNGCSVAALADGKSVDTSMGFTPLEGLVMGTRSGDVDASIVTYLAEREKVEPAEVEQWLNERSGLLGVSGRSNDMKELLRAVEQERDERAKLAIELFCYRARKYLGAYLAVLGGADALIFGGGIGENAPEIRERVCFAMEWCGVSLDHARNQAAVGLPAGSGARISTEGSRPSVYVVAADEETWIAMETARCLST
ncbi:MAG TPA: acetate kinase [Nitrospira sp.]|nr:acetate kinase [Nitrospira sp.]